MTNIGHIIAAYHTDQGQVREHNEDFVMVIEPSDEQKEAQNGWLCVVADGVGGAEAGEVASEFATQQTVSHFLEDQEQKNWEKRLYNAVQAAHNDLCDLIATRQGQGRMGTTLVALSLTGNSAVFANVGDSRAYLCRWGRIRQITKDHSLVVKLLEEGIISPEEADELNIGNIILQSIGSEQPPTIDIFTESLLDGDRILLCSDGLNTHVEDDEMAALVSEHPPQQAAEKLVALANERGGHDNITVMVLQYGEAA